MLGRGVAERLVADPAAPLFAPEVAERVASADAFVLNLECCISERGSRFPEPGKPFFFRAPPAAAWRLAELGVDAVTLANNHTLDYGVDALLDTLAHLQAAGIAAVGAGTSEEMARAHRLLRCGELNVRLLSFSDHPANYAAGLDSPGIAFADLSTGLPAWVQDAMDAGDGDALVVTPHWGPNMVTEPVVTSAAPPMSSSPQGRRSLQDTLHTSFTARPPVCCSTSETSSTTTRSTVRCATTWGYSGSSSWSAAKSAGFAPRPSPWITASRAPRRVPKPTGSCATCGHCARLLGPRSTRKTG